ncbi:MAG: hypothetical protein EXR58_02095 [Chloroflexi bacterium]|nr:hypothetical protein [Chloroflexota bacterium]
MTRPDPNEATPLNLAAEQQFWAAIPVILRTLGEDDSPAFMDRNIEMFEREPALIGRLMAVSTRLGLIERLREERIVAGQDIYAERQWRDIDQLTAFLAATCIPIAENAADEPGDAIHQAFVKHLPEWARLWLAQNYMVLPSAGNRQQAIADWSTLGDAQKCRLIAAHLAAATESYRRTVDYAQWDWHDRLHMSQAMREAPFEFAWLHRAGDPTMQVDTAVGIRSGLAESEALRFLLVTHLRSRLLCEDQEDFVDQYWARRRVRIWALRAIKELDVNSRHIHGWAARAMYDRPFEADFAPLAGLESTAIHELLADPSSAARYSGTSIQTLEGYLGKISRLNERIDRLNQRHQEPAFDITNKADEEESLFAAVLADPETRELLRQIQSLHLDLSRAV